MLQHIPVLSIYVSSVCGGQGAVRDIIEYYLRENGIWTDVVCQVYGIGV